MAKFHLEELKAFTEQSNDLALLPIKAKTVNGVIHFTPFCSEAYSELSYADWPSIPLEEFFETLNSHCPACQYSAFADSPTNRHLGDLLDHLKQLSRVKPEVTKVLDYLDDELEEAFIHLDSLERENLLGGKEVFSHFLKEPILDEISRVRRELQKKISKGCDVSEFVLPMAREVTSFSAPLPPLAGLDSILENYEQLQEDAAQKLAKDPSWCLVSFGSLLQDPIHVPGVIPRFKAILQANRLENNVFFLPLAAVAYYLKHSHVLRDSKVKPISKSAKIKPPEFIEGADFRIGEAAAVLFNPEIPRGKQEAGVYSTLRAAYAAALLLD